MTASFDYENGIDQKHRHRGNGSAHNIVPGFIKTAVTRFFKTVIDFALAVKNNANHQSVIFSICTFV